MKAPPFAYHDPHSVGDLIGLLGRLENARLLAGGQSLIPMLNMRYAFPDHVIDLNRIPELAYIEEQGQAIRIGAMTRQQRLERDPLIRERIPALAEALRFVGHVQTRSRGTIGGSLCHLDPSAELPGIAALYDATLHVVGPRGQRDIPMRDWGLSYMTPSIEPDEALVALTIPCWSEPHWHGFVEFSRRHGDFAIVAAAALLAIDERNVIRRAAISLVGVDVRPVRLDASERALLCNDASLAEAAELARSTECFSDVHVSGEYRRRLAVALTRRALQAAAQRARGHIRASH